jgi:hypothetical protein
MFNLPSDVTMFSVKSDKALKLDVLSYEVQSDDNPFAESGDLHMERTFYTHRGIGASDNSYICPAKTWDKPCPICEYRAKLANDKDADEDTLKELRPKERQLWNIRDLDSPEKGVQLWDISFHLFGKQLDAAIRNSDEEDEFEFYADNEDGHTLKVGIKERSFGGRAFYEAETIYFKERKEQYDEEILDEVHDLDSILKEYSYKELKAIFLQLDNGDGDDDDDDDAPAPRRERRKRKPKAPEPVEEPEDDEEDDEPEEKPKARNTRTRKPKPAPEPEDDEEDDEPEDLNPAPKPKRTRKAKPAPEPEPEDDDDWEDDEEPAPPAKKAKKAPAPKKARKPKPAPEPEPEDDGEDEDWDDWED